MLRPVNRKALAHIVHHMRQSDETEIFALRWDVDGALDKDRFVDELMELSSFSWTAHANDGEPVAVIGARPMWPGVWGVYAFGTDRWRSVALLLTKTVLRRIVPVLQDDMKAHLAFCYARADNTQAREWLEHLGLKCEHVIREFGRDRGDYAFHARRA